MHPITKCQLNSYILGKTLGRGTFGKVKLGMHKITGQPVAIKILEKAKIKDVTDVERVSRELHILKITQHSSIAQMYEIIETQLNIFIVMEYAPGGEFFDYIMDAKIKGQQQAHQYFVQIVAGLEYLHKLKISHRDIKPQNMLLDNNNRLKIVDFGLSNMYKQGQMLLTACGSPCYASPQMIKGQAYDPQLTDVWSLGVVLFSMIFAKLPFEDDNTSVLYSKIKSGLYVIDKRISSQLRDLLSKLLCVKPKLRLSIQQIKQHTWYKKQKICKCNGVVVGYQNITLDDNLLNNMRQLGYNVQLTRKFLQNNIRNESTTAYYLLMKKKLRTNDPSPQDISNQNFNRKNIIAKFCNLNKSLSKIRHNSVNINSPLQSSTNKQTLQVEQYIFSPKRLRKINEVVKKQRNCFSQMKSQQYDNYRTQMKSFEVYKMNKHNSLKKSLQNHFQNGKFARQSIYKVKRQDNSRSLLKQRRKSLNNNISINVYINNAKIQTPSKKGKKNSKLLNEKQKIKTNNDQLFLKSLKFSDFSNKRLKTEMIDRSDAMESKIENKRAHRYQSVHQHDTQSKSLQKSNQISLMEGTFWKKKSVQNKHREHTTQSRQDRRQKLKKW